MPVAFKSALDDSECKLEPIRVGKPLNRQGSHDIHLIIETERTPVLRIDLYTDLECCAFQDAQIWRDLILIGYGESLHLVNPKSKTSKTIILEGYFGHIYLFDNFALIASALDLQKISPDGEVVWKSSPLGIDGVIVEGIQNDFIVGQGEWDPPGGWKPFRLNLNSGAIN